jgi:hypothetical protein
MHFTQDALSANAVGYGWVHATFFCPVEDVVSLLYHGSDGVIGFGDDVQ